MAQMGHTSPNLALAIYAREMDRRDGEPERLRRRPLSRNAAGGSAFRRRPLRTATSDHFLWRPEAVTRMAPKGENRGHSAVLRAL
jgi:hypothetical protein